MFLISNLEPTPMIILSSFSSTISCCAVNYCADHYLPEACRSLDVRYVYAHSNTINLFCFKFSGSAAENFLTQDFIDCLFYGSCSSLICSLMNSSWNDPHLILIVKFRAPSQLQEENLLLLMCMQSKNLLIWLIKSVFFLP